MASITISATDANQQFAEILGRAVNGETIIITKRGEPVAQLVKYQSETLSPERQAAGERLMAQLREPIPVPVGWVWNRDELYERD